MGQDIAPVAVAGRDPAAAGVRSGPDEVPMSVPADLLAILVCPKCKGDLEHRTAPKEELVCLACRLIYAVEDDIPIMLIDEATPF
jgi:hypothetical protein